MDLQDCDVRALLDEVSAAGNDFLGSAGDIAKGLARRRLVAAAQKLIHGAQNPLEAVTEISLQVERT